MSKMNYSLMPPADLIYYRGKYLIDNLQSSSNLKVDDFNSSLFPYDKYGAVVTGGLYDFLYPLATDITKRTAWDEKYILSLCIECDIQTTSLDHIKPTEGIDMMLYPLITEYNPRITLISDLFMLIREELSKHYRLSEAAIESIAFAILGYLSVLTDFSREELKDKSASTGGFIEFCENPFIFTSNVNGNIAGYGLYFKGVYVLEENKMVCDPSKYDNFFVPLYDKEIQC